MRERGRSRGGEEGERLSILIKNKAERARLRAVSGEDAGAAFNALPSTTMHLALPSAHFRVITARLSFLREKYQKKLIYT